MARNTLLEHQIFYIRGYKIEIQNHYPTGGNPNRVPHAAITLFGLHSPSSSVKSAVLIFRDYQSLPAPTYKNSTITIDYHSHSLGPIISLLEAMAVDRMELYCQFKDYTQGAYADVHAGRPYTPPSTLPVPSPKNIKKQKCR